MSLNDDFRAAMRRLAATVTLVTMDAGGRPLGMVATAVSSLCAGPPSLLLCVSRTASMHADLVAAPGFCINILHREQEAMARIFADPAQREARFAAAGWSEEGGIPVLSGAQALLLCDRVQQMDYGTHSIIIGAVRRVRLREDIDPLLYLDGRFTRCA